MSTFYFTKKQSITLPSVNFDNDNTNNTSHAFRAGNTDVYFVSAHRAIRHQLCGEPPRHVHVRQICFVLHYVSNSTVSMRLDETLKLN